jgi:hypothetical protein
LGEGRPRGGLEAHHRTRWREDPVVVRELTAADLGDDVLLDLIRSEIGSAC